MPAPTFLEMFAAHTSAASGPPVAGYSAWYDPSDTSSITEASGLVSQLNDKSGNGYHLTASGTARPTTGTRTQGGLNVLDFDGSTDKLDSSSFALAQPFTVFVVGALDVTATGMRSFSAITTAVSFGHSSTQWTMQAGSTVASNTPNTVPHVQTAVFDNTSSILYIDGVRATSGTAGTNGITVGIRLGVTSNGTSSWWDGWIGEVLIYPSVLSTADRKAVEAHLYTKWQTPVAGMAGWWDASDTSTITDTAGAVTQWNDKSGQERHLTPATTSPTTGTRTQNSLNVIDFLTSFMNAANAIALTQPFTVFGVALSDVLGTRRFWGSSTSSAGVGISATQWVMTAGTALGGGTSDTAAHVYAAVFNGASSELFIDGASVVSGDPSTGSITGVLRVGAVTGGGSPWDGPIGEVRVYGGVLTTTERQAIEAELKTKWGTP